MGKVFDSDIMVFRIRSHFCERIRMGGWLRNYAFRLLERKRSLTDQFYISLRLCGCE